MIIVDDGSTDNSKEIIESYNDNRIKPHYQKNKGQAAAFNSGVAKASGQFIAFMDSDDTWKDNKLEKCIKHFERNNFSIVQHRLEIIDSLGNKLGKYHPVLKPGAKNVLSSYFNEQHTGFFSVSSGLVCRKSDLKIIFPIDEEWKICADVAVSRPLALFGDIYTIPEILGYYRIHGNNNWMDTVDQENYINNEFKYCQYTEHWTKTFGYKNRIDLKQSELYWSWKAVNKSKNKQLRFIDRLKRFLLRKKRKFINSIKHEFH